MGPLPIVQPAFTLSNAIVPKIIQSTKIPSKPIYKIRVPTTKQTVKVQKPPISSTFTVQELKPQNDIVPLLTTRRPTTTTSRKTTTRRTTTPRTTTTTKSPFS